MAVNRHVPAARYLSAKTTDALPVKRKQRLKELKVIMLLDAHLTFAKNIEIDEVMIRQNTDSTIRNTQFKIFQTPRFTLTILDQLQVKNLTLVEKVKREKENDKCTKCRKKEKTPRMLC